MESKQEAPRQLKMLRISEEMKQWSAMLEQELRGWPGVSSRPMFGFIGLYRKNTIFAALPRSRAMVTSSSIIFRFDSMPAELSNRAQDDPRIDFARHAPGKRWFSFALTSPEDLRDALWWLEQAYRRAKNKPGGTSKRRAKALRARRK